MRTTGEHATEQATDARTAIVLRDQGSFMVGGTVLTAPDGDTFHGDHAYVQYQIPLRPRRYPLVMWHGGSQFSKTWESTPDGRDGYQNIFIRRGFATYIVDQARRGRAGRSTTGLTIPDGVPNESELWAKFRLGIWPDFFPNVQFSRDPEALEQYYRQQTPDTGPATPAERDVIVDSVAALFAKIGPAVLITHSASGRLGWVAAMKAPNVKAIVCYETGGYVFPENELPPQPVFHEIIPARLTSFAKLTRIPIQIVFGDNIPTRPSAPRLLDNSRVAFSQARLFVDAINKHGGDAELLHLPQIGIYGNTHFPFSDLNNAEIADLLSGFLRRKGLDEVSPAEVAG